MKHVASLMFTAALVWSNAAAAQNGGFPAGPDKALVQEKCTGCHVGNQVTNQRRSAGQWAQSVEMMVGYGLQVSDAEFERIVNYLTAHFGPKKSAASVRSDKSG